MIKQHLSGFPDCVCGGFGEGDNYTYAFMDIIPEEDRLDALQDAEGWIRLKDVNDLVNVFEMLGLINQLVSVKPEEET